MSYSTIFSAVAQSTDGKVATTGNTNTIGATLIVLGVGYGTTSGGTLSVSDNQGNTYTQVFDQSNAGNTDPHAAMFYVVNPITSATHTFTAQTGNGNQIFPTIVARGYSGNAATPLDTFNSASNSSSTTTQATGSVSPALTNSLIVAVHAHNVTSTDTAVSSISGNSFSFIRNLGLVSLQAYGVAYAEFIQTNIAGENVTFTNTSSAAMTAGIAVFKSADGSLPATGSAASPFVRIRKAHWPGGIYH